MAGHTLPSQSTSFCETATLDEIVDVEGRRKTDGSAASVPFEPAFGSKKVGHQFSSINLAKHLAMNFRYPKEMRRGAGSWNLEWGEWRRGIQGGTGWEESCCDIGRGCPGQCVRWLASALPLASQPQSHVAQPQCLSRSTRGTWALHSSRAHHLHSHRSRTPAAPFLPSARTVGPLRLSGAGDGAGTIQAWHLASGERAMGRFLDGEPWKATGAVPKVRSCSPSDPRWVGFKEEKGRSLERGWKRRPLGIPSVALLALIALLIYPTADGPRATKQGCNDLTLSLLHCLPLFLLRYGT